ncbi:MAG: hypothetical protein JO323_14145 [Acidobacteriia bacterium]|nr:hypothetical protein [Terriglobia bacterium]
MVRKICGYGFLMSLAAVGVLADPGDPPSRVARLNYETGPVSFRPAAADDWTAAVPNYPLSTGDHLWADAGAQAELHAGAAAIRLNQQTALSFLNLDDRTVQLSLTQGAIHVRLRALGDDEVFEVDTPNAAIALLRPGDYRIQTDGDTAVTLVAVPTGQAEVTGGGTAFTVYPRQAARLTGTDSLSRDLVDVPPPDAFDRWSTDRDRREEQVQSVKYVPREMIGYEDLDTNGVWREVPPYGWVWRPTVVTAGWAPYRYGHWAWVAPWGWTWVDDAPWGFAPFHYGRWALAEGVWVWIPGRMVARPVYAPALVAFVGGPHFSLSVSIGGGGGGVAWFPLGPGEVYRPAYHVSEVYVRNINVTHLNVTNINVTNVNVTNVRYVNQNVQGAVTAVPQQTFVSARPVAPAATVVPPREAAQAQVLSTTAAVAPRPESIVARPAGGTVVRPPAHVMERTVAVKSTPPPPPVSFRAQQQALQAHPGQPLDANTINGLRGSPGAAANVPRVRTAQAPPAAQQNGPGFNPRNDRPPNAVQLPSAAPARPYPTPQPNERPAAVSPGIRNDRPAAVPEAQPRPAPAAAPPQPNERPAAVSPGGRNDRPAAAAPRNDRPAYATPPARTPPPRRNEKESERNKRDEHKENR